MKQIESLEFREAARANCYKYGDIYVYTGNIDLSLDSHSFPNYESSRDPGAVEQLMALVQGMVERYSSSSALEKQSKPVPGVSWGADKFEWDMTLDGVMYFTSYTDYTDSLTKIRTDILQQGWVFTSGATVTYKPKMSAGDALYADDPIDAAGRALMTSAMQHITDQVKMMMGRVSGDKKLFAEGYVRSNFSLLGQTGLNIPANLAQGHLDNYEQAFKAFGSNLNGAVAGKWLYAGHPVELRLNGETQKKSINMVLTKLDLTERAYVVDDTSDGAVYPTELKVSMSMHNLYGYLANTAIQEKKSR